MRKYVSEGKFKRVCAMPETKLFIATKVSNQHSLTMHHEGIRVGGEQVIKQTLIARHRGFYYFQYTDWNGDTRHYRQDVLPGHIGFIIGLNLLVECGGFYKHEQPIDVARSLFHAKVKIELV